MIAGLPSLTGLLRRSRGAPSVVDSLNGDDIALSSGETLLKRKRLKVAIFAIIFGLISAAIELPLPAEDGFRLAKAWLRMRDAPQDIVLVAIDDATLNELRLPFPTRKEESRLIDQLAAAGVTKIIFDRAHADPETPESDALFIRTLERHRGKVWLGMASGYKVGNQEAEALLPDMRFQSRAQVASMAGYLSPFQLAIVFPTSKKLSGKTYPAISAVLADYQGPDLSYRPDFAFNPHSIPVVSYGDVINGRFDKASLAGKKAIIGQTSTKSPDMFIHPLYQRISGTYYHIIGAQTLKRGTPVDLMWFLAILVAAVVIAVQAFARSRSSRPLWAAAVGLPAISLVLDEAGINIDIMSAMLAIGVAAFGFYRISKKYYSAGVDAMTTTALGLDKANAEFDVYALKIANLAEISEEWGTREMGEFVNTLITYIKGPGDVGDVALERDSLVWLAPRMDNDSLERHADGLALMLKTAISHDWQSASSAPAIGIDTNYTLPLGQRVKKAMQAADEAAVRGVRFVINDAAYVEARNQRLEIIRVLEKGLRDRNIGDRPPLSGPG